MFRFKLNIQDAAYQEEKTRLVGSHNNNDQTHFSSVVNHVSNYLPYNQDAANLSQVSKEIHQLVKETDDGKIASQANELEWAANKIDQCIMPVNNGCMPTNQGCTPLMTGSALVGSAAGVALVCAVPSATTAAIACSAASDSACAAALPAFFTGLGTGACFGGIASICCSFFSNKLGHQVSDMRNELNIAPNARSMKR